MNVYLYWGNEAPSHRRQNVMPAHISYTRDISTGIITF